MVDARHGCPDCGGVHGDEPCPARRSGADRTGRSGPFVVLSGSAAGDPATALQPSVPLVREYKGAAVEDLLDDEDEALERLPSRVAAALRRLEDGDVADAERVLDDAVGSLLPGPGYARLGRRPRGSRLTSIAALLLVVALGGLAALLLAMVVE